MNPTLAPWFTDYRMPRHGTKRVFAFPYSGAGSLAYLAWARQWQNTGCDFLGVQLPGRESRLRETCITHIPTLVQHLVTAIRPLLDKPFVFFGHSLGALIAFELCRALRHHDLPLPEHLVVSAFRAPDMPNPNPPLGHLADIDLVAALRAYGGTPEAVLEHADLLEFILPIVRADFTLHETYHYQYAEPLPCPITAFCGEHDPFLNPNHVEGWRKQTSAYFDQVVYPGEHFFLNDVLPEMRQYLLTAFASESEVVAQ